MSLSNSDFQTLQNIAGKDLCTRKPEDLLCYAYDATAEVYLPDAVVFPQNVQQVSAILTLADKSGFFVIPRGAGSGLTGGSLPVRGGVVLVMNRMNRILAIDKDNLIAHVEPGVITAQFHRAVEQQGLFYPPDPASSEFSTLGGNLAECAGGPRAVKYGVTRDYVLGLEVVLPAGQIIRTGVQTAKGVVGYDLTRLIVGSEGTLGVITQMTLRLLPLPESIRTMTAMFDKIETAAQTVSAIIRQGIVPRTIEFMDNASLRCVEAHLGMGLPVEADAMLLIETDGTSGETENSLKKIETLCRSQGAAVNIAKTPEERAKLWQARKAVSPALFRYGPHKINEDIVVPRSKIPDMVKTISALREESGLFIAAFGHAGDGNIHFTIMLDKRNFSQMKKAEEVVDKLFDETLALGGTISGEHGIGITKLPYLSKEIGFVETELMKKIKAVFDPKGILNPGKIFRTKAEQEE
jgi:glycolate oxidase